MEKRILIVDDDENFRDFVLRAFSKEGWILDTAGTVDEAIASARQQRPDLILLDIGLPRLDGYDLCDMLIADGIPILFVSGRPYREERLRAEYSGAIGYLQKPLKPDELRQAVRTALKQTQARKT